MSQIHGESTQISIQRLKVQSKRYIRFTTIPEPPLPSPPLNCNFDFVNRIQYFLAWNWSSWYDIVQCILADFSRGKTGTSGYCEEVRLLLLLPWQNTMTYLRIKRDVFQRVFIVIPLKFFSFFSSMDNYTEQFKSLKGSRTLQWKPHLGLVDLELELEDRTLSFTVTPARAATIMNFQQKRKLIIII